MVPALMVFIAFHGLMWFQQLVYARFVSPQNLLQRLPSPSMDWQTRLRAASQLADAITSLHEMGVIHRDIKSANVPSTDSTSFFCCKILHMTYSQKREPAALIAW